MVDVADLMAGCARAKVGFGYDFDGVGGTGCTVAGKMDGGEGAGAELGEELVVGEFGNVC